MIKDNKNIILRFLSLIALVLILGCEKSFIESTEDTRTKLIESHLEDAKDTSRSIENRKKSTDIAYSLYSNLDNNKYKREKAQDLSSIYHNLKDYEASKRMDEKMLELSKLIKDSLGLAKSYANLGIYYRDKQLDSAYSNFNRADKIYKSFDKSEQFDKKQYTYDHGKVLIDLAKLSRKVKDYAESEDLTVKAIERFEISENLRYVPLSYNNLGLIARYMERYDDAVFYHQKAIENAKIIGKDTLYSVIGNNNIGTVYEVKGDYQKAEEYYLKALSFDKFFESRRERYARLLHNLAYARFLANRDDESVLELFNKSSRISDSLNDQIGSSTSNLHYAEYYQHKGNDSLAKLYALKVKEAAPVVNNNVELLKAYQLLTEVSDSEEGLAYAQKHIVLNDSLIKEERSHTNKFARIKFESQKKTEEIAQISKENQYLIFAILGLSVLFLLGYVIFRQQQSNKELLFEQKQQQSNQEIYRLLLSQQLKLEEGRKMEQHRMSEELHDGVLGRLFGVRLSLDGINQRANDGFTDARNKYIEELKSIEREIRLISHDLGTETLSPDIAYVDVVESLVSDLCTVHKMEFEFANDENIDWEVVDDQKKVNLFRIIQESLQNIFKHAKAKSVKINFDYVDDKINLTILDDGIGFKSSKVKRGIGLKNITSRVTQMNGVVDFISNQDAGTKVSVGIPI
ncbi:hypothetical protein GCM10009430_41640 [Aquimarina litoralis]|uniref:histidine kinase n=1 Tax=Aquimarina litoralis TaxID=584605 RepID=A0ABN1J6S7_9FLAO